MLIRLKKPQNIFFKKHFYIIILIILTSFFIAYPYMTLWSVIQAIQNHNIQHISKDIDWSSVKKQLKKDLIQEMDLNPPSSDELPEFGNSFASTSITNAIDLHVDSSTLEHGLGLILPPTDMNTTSSINMAFLAFKNAHIHYFSPWEMRAEVTLANQKEPLFITMRLKQWRWKITSITLPPSIITSLLNGD